jgi:hypothetical protein
MNDEEAMRKLRAMLKERDAQFAFALAANVRNTLDMIDQSPPATIGALISLGQELQKPNSGAPRHRQKVRAALIEYCEGALIVSCQRESELFRAITGLDEPPDRDRG